MMDQILISIGLVALATGFAVNVASQATYKQRQKLMPKANDPHFWEKMAVFDSISYNRHMFHILTFRNPYLLYKKRYEEIENG